MIRKTSFLNHESPCHLLKIFKLLNKREERWNNVGKTTCNFFSNYLWNVSCTCAFIRNNESLKLVGYKILIYLITGMMDSYLNLSRDF